MTKTVIYLWRVKIRGEKHKMQIGTINIQTLVFSILGGVVIFLFGINMMNDFLKKIAGSKLKLILEKATNNPIKGILAGLLLTMVIQSSGATIAIVIGLVSARLLNLKNAVGIIFGAKIGTTVTSILISFNLGTYAPIIIFIGGVLYLFFKQKIFKNIGGAILGFGLLFLGLNLMSGSFGEIAHTEAFEDFLVSAGNHPILGLLIGTLATALIQSSSASIGILQKAYTTGTIPLIVAIAIVFGSNIGNTITSVMASIKAGNEGKKVAFLHVVISAISALLFFIFIKPYTSLIIYVSNLFGINHTNSMFTIALSHIILNIISVLILFWFTKQFVMMANLFVKGKKEIVSQKVILDKTLIHVSPEFALENAKQAIQEMGEISIQMYEFIEKFSFDNDESAYELAMQCEEMLNQLDVDIHNYLVQIGAQNLDKRQMQIVAKYIDSVTDFERVGDHLENLSEFFIERHENKIVCGDAVKAELDNFFAHIKNQLVNVVKSFSETNVFLAKKIMENENNINALFKEYRHNNTMRISKDLQENHFNHYVDIISNLERVGDHCYNIAENIVYKDFTHIKKTVRA